MLLATKPRWPAWMPMRLGVLERRWSLSWLGFKIPWPAVVEEARRKAEDEASLLAVERVSLLLELGTSKDEVSALQAQALKEKKALEEAYE